MANEEIYVTEGWSGRIYALQEQGHDIGYYDPPQSFGWQECLFVIKGSPMAACEELINFMLDEETSIAVAEGQSYPPAPRPDQWSKHKTRGKDPEASASTPRAYVLRALFTPIRLNGKRRNEASGRIWNSERPRPAAANRRATGPVVQGAGFPSTGSRMP